MAVMELKLDSLKFANVYGFERDFGKKKNSLTNGGSLTSKEFNEANALPFDLMRPTTILETTNILSVEYDAKLNISAPAEITLTIGNGSYIGQTCTVVNSSAVAHKIGINGDTVSISPKNRIVFEWYGETWESEDLRTVGTIKAYGGSTAPLGYLLCNGQEVSRSTYSTLFAVIGVKYGVGDGTTTFTLPDFRDRTLQGASDTHALGEKIDAGLPNITAEIYVNTQGNVGSKSGAFKESLNGSERVNWSGNANTTSIPIIKFDASDSNEIYKNNCDTVQPPAQTCNFIIKT